MVQRFLSICLALLILPLWGEVDPLDSAKKAPEESLLLDELYAAYKAGKFEDTLLGFFGKETKEGGCDSFIDEEASCFIFSFELESSLFDAIEKLKKEQEVVKMARKYPDDPLCQEILSLHAFQLSKEDKKCLQTLCSLRNKFKGDGKSPLENRLIELDLQYGLKERALSEVYQEGRLAFEEFQKKSFSLQEERVKEMKEAAMKHGEDQELSCFIEKASSFLPKLEILFFTREHLHALGRGKMAPKSEAERELQKVLFSLFN